MQKYGFRWIILPPKIRVATLIQAWFSKIASGDYPNRVLEKNSHETQIHVLKSIRVAILIVLVFASAVNSVQNSVFSFSRVLPIKTNIDVKKHMVKRRFQKKRFNEND